MSRNRAQRTTARTSAKGDAGLGIAIAPNEVRSAPGFTGRYLVSMHRDGVPDGVKFLRTTAGLNVASTSDGGVIKAADARGADAFMLDRIGIAVVNAPPDQLNFIRAAVDTGPVRRITRERYVHVASSGVGAAMRPSGAAGSISEYVAGYRDGVDGLAEALVGGRTEAGPRSATLAIELPPETEWTWGLQVTGVSQSSYSGKGIKAAVLDTGIDLDHPDFAGRAIASKSFVANFHDAHDGHGHGTHCVGTACGPLTMLSSASE